jgi:hypothetical protein
MIVEQINNKAEQISALQVLKVPEVQNLFFGSAVDGF